MAPQEPENSSPLKNFLADKWIALTILIVGLGGLAAAFKYVTTPPKRDATEERAPRGDNARTAPPAPQAAHPPRSLQEPHITNYWGGERGVTYWWDKTPGEIASASVDTSGGSNVRPADYAGSQSCKQCHKENYEAWWNHSHRLMNVSATPENVVGDFSGRAPFPYLGGVAEFFQQDGGYRMAFAKDGVRRVYRINRTIGSRFFQYYVGKVIDGPDPDDAPCKTVEHVLPLGYWIDKKEWAPAVHVQGDDTDNDVWDPYDANDLSSYDLFCGSCHTTLSAGDWMLRSGGRKRLTEYTPRPVSFQFSDYLAEAHPEVLKGGPPWNQTPSLDVLEAFEALNEIEIPKHAVELGITCEACHNGCKEHLALSKENASGKLPSFFPESPHVFSKETDVNALRGRNDINANFVCAKCHVGRRPEYANGGHTWNSTEFADAVRGGCYDTDKADKLGMKSLTCIHCHDPHTGIGKKWTRPPEADNQSCLDCHGQFKTPEARSAHTHHAPDSRGSDCMSCHMPKITEGMQDMVRSHRIFSPTEPRMLEANQPNACNLCHLDKPIDWTLGHLKDWYYLREINEVPSASDAAYSEARLAPNYPRRAGPAGDGWIRSPHAPTRIAGMEALTKADARWALPGLIEMLKDSHIINRQFTQKNIDEMLGVKLKDMGYQYYLAPPERAEAVERIRERLMDKEKPAGSGGI